MADQQYSLMSGEEIKTRGLIVQGQDSLYRATTYDLSIGDIVAVGPDGTSTVKEYRLRPGGTVRVVTRESLQMPDDVTAHVLLKNALCRQGVLAINIGVVDPGFSGPLSSTLINFGRVNFDIRMDMSFLRASFHRCPPSTEAAKAKKWDRAEYLDEVRRYALAYSAPTFLNLEETIARAADGAFGSFKQYLVLWATLAALALALLTMFVPLGASYADRYVAGRDGRAVEMRQAIEKKLENEYGVRLKSLSDQVEELQKSAAARANSNRAGGRR